MARPTARRVLVCLLLLLAAGCGESLRLHHPTRSGLLPTNAQGQQTLRLLVLMVNFPTTWQSRPTVAQVDSMFTCPGGVNAFWAEDSYGKLAIETDIRDWIRISIPRVLCDFESMTAPTIAKADSVYPDINFLNYDGLVILTPYYCPGIGGRGTIGRSPIATPDGWANLSVTWIYARDCTSGEIIHELGHNLGLPHSRSYSCTDQPIGTTCTTYEYGDRYSIMGSGYINHNSAPHKEALGWFEPSNLLDVTASGTYVLEPYETIGSGLKALKIHRGTGDQFVYVEYRQPLGFDATITTGDVFKGGTIHLLSNCTENNSILIDASTPPTGDNVTAALLVGRTLIDPDTGTEIKVTGRTPGVSLTVQVTLGDLAPRITIVSPASGSTVTDVVTVEAEVISPTSPVDSVEFYGGAGGEPFAVLTAAPWEVPLDTSLLPNGRISVYARAYTATRSCSSDAVTYTVSNTDPVFPEVSLLNVLDGDIFAGFPGALQAAASDNKGVTWVTFRYWYSATGDPYGGPEFGHLTDYTPPYTGFPNYNYEGFWAVTVTARDYADNETTIGPIRYRQDSTAPTVAWISPTAGETLHGLVLLQVNASDAVAGLSTVECCLDSCNMVICRMAGPPYQCQWNTRYVSDRPHQLIVRTRDAAGHESLARETVIVRNAKTGSDPPLPTGQ